MFRRAHLTTLYCAPVHIVGVLIPCKAVSASWRPRIVVTLIAAERTCGDYVQKQNSEGSKDIFLVLPLCTGNNLMRASWSIIRAEDEAVPRDQGQQRNEALVLWVVLYEIIRAKLVLA